MFKKQIIERFGTRADDQDILASLTKLVSVFDISVEELYINWETFTFSKKNSDTKLSVESLSELQQYIIKNIERKNKTNGSQSSTKKMARKIGFDMMPSTPLSVSKRKSNVSFSIEKRQKKNPDESVDDITFEGISVMEQSPIAAKNDKNENSGRILSTLNPSIAKSAGESSFDQGQTTLAANFDPAKYKFRNMRQKLLEASDVLDEQIDNFAAILTQEFPEITVSSPATVSQQDVVVVGRITPDSVDFSAEERLNAQSLCIEPSRSVGIGQRVPLSLLEVSDFAFFPGQIVALRGKNTNGKFFAVSEVIELPLLGSATTSAQEFEEFNQNLNGQDLKMIITSGPYMDDSMSYDKLQEFVDKMNEDTKPHSIVMFGPFLDYSHPKIVQGDLESCFPAEKLSKLKSLDDVFQVMCVPILNQLNSKIQVVLIPSTKDIPSKHSSYPQDAFHRRSLGLNKNFKCFPNPAQFQINECVIGASNNDIFKDLSDVAQGTFAETNRLDRIASHVLEQRRFYPLFPGGLTHQKIKLITPPPDTSDFKIHEQDLKPDLKENFEIQQVGGADLDVPYLGLTEFTDATPDILVIPSQLKHFVRVVKNVVVINPGQFVKRRGGSFAEITLEKAKLNENVTKVNDDEMYLNDIWRRARVDIIGV